jgi:AcrR family transcriptional regulator
MLEAAVERVKSEGLLLDYANIELENLIRAAGVPRSTVFRIWPDRMAFIADLVRALFEADPGFEAGFDGETLGMLQQAFGAPAGATRSAEEKQVALRAAVRVAVAHNIVAVENSMAWRAYKTMSAALASGDAVPGGDEIRTLLGEIEDRYVDRMSALYAQLNAAVGIRMRDGVTEGDLALAIMSVIDGMADHRRINPPFVDRARRVEMGPEGPMDWHLAGLAVYGVYAAFTEERDDETATAGEEP